MLVDNQSVDDLVEIHAEIERLTATILNSLERRKTLKKRLGVVFDELRQSQSRLPFDKAEAAEAQPAPAAPAPAPSSNGKRGKRAEAPAVQP